MPAGSDKSAPPQAASLSNLFHADADQRIVASCIRFCEVANGFHINFAIFAADAGDYAMKAFAIQRFAIALANVYQLQQTLALIRQYIR